MERLGAVLPAGIIQGRNYLRISYKVTCVCLLTLCNHVEVRALATRMLRYLFCTVQAKISLLMSPRPKYLPTTHNSCSLVLMI